MTFAVKKPDFPLPDGVYKIIRGSKAKYPKLSIKQYWDNVRRMNDGIDLFIIPVLVKEFMSLSDAHLNEQAVDQVMKNLAIELAKRIVKRDESADHAELQFRNQNIYVTVRYALNGRNRHVNNILH